MINYLHVENANLFERREAEGKVAFIDNMTNVSAVSPEVIYDFEERFGEYICVTGFIKPLNASVYLEFCTTDDGQYSSPVLVEPNHEIDLGIFDAIKKN